MTPSEAGLIPSHPKTSRLNSSPLGQGASVEFIRQTISLQPWHFAKTLPFLFFLNILALTTTEFLQNPVCSQRR